MSATAEKTAPPTSPLRAWVFTVFNPTPEICERIVALQFKSDRLVVGREKCPTTGTPHLQGYIRLIASIRFSGIKKLLPDGAHILSRNGTESQAANYCKKDGDILIDHGIDCDRGRENALKRTRDEELEEVLEEIEKGEKYGAIRNRHKKFFFWHRRNIVDYIHDEQHLRANSGFCPTRGWDVDRGV